MIDQLASLPRQDVGIDQGIHNFVVHTGLVAGTRLVANGAGPVATLGVMAPDAAEALVRSGRVNIVHQHDRHPQLAGTLSTLLREVRKP
jgi:ABC-type enterobactin transport system permease subunit